ncbi:flagellar biosynthesis anti-sigma factor FlgM [Ornithinibacillus sp. 4-3]|uniref:Negative regulator of flagellin synthesis n=1 Tax=Ornithinibacillus sp. 4-3 TaxID=3231488 RepID=A0AB39HTF0_9BACI
MKIQGPNFSKIHAYQNQMQVKKEQAKEHVSKEDKLDISNEAKKLQMNQQKTEERDNHIQNIKSSIKSGSYEIDYQKTAKKMLKFWSR